MQKLVLYQLTSIIWLTTAPRGRVCPGIRIINNNNNNQIIRTARQLPHLPDFLSFYLLIAFNNNESNASNMLFSPKALI